MAACHGNCAPRARLWVQQAEGCAAIGSCYNNHCCSCLGGAPVHSHCSWLLAGWLAGAQAAGGAGSC